MPTDETRTWCPTFGAVIRAARLRFFPAPRHGVWLRIAPDGDGPGRHRLETRPPGLIAESRGRKGRGGPYALLPDGEADVCLDHAKGLRVNTTRPCQYTVLDDGSVIA